MPNDVVSPAPDPVAAEVTPGPSPRPWTQRLTRRRRPARRKRLGALVILAIAWLALMVVLIIGVQWLPLTDPGAPVGRPQSGPELSINGLLGFDYIGRSVLSRDTFGARASLGVSLLAVTIGMTVGGAIGIAAGYFRGKTDAVVGLVTDTVLAFPPLVLLIAVTATLRTSFVSLAIALSLISIPAFSRMARANTVTLANRDFVRAARALGASPIRVIFKEIVPTVLLPLISYGSLIVAVLIVAEGSLSYLGFGIPPPTPSWGGMIAGGQQFLSTNPWLVVIPAATMFLTVLSFNVIGDWARTRSDVRGAAI